MKKFKNNFGVASDSLPLLEAFITEAEKAGWGNQETEDLNYTMGLFFNANLDEDEGGKSDLEIGHFWSCGDVVGHPLYNLPTEWDEAIKAMKAKLPKPKAVKPKHLTLGDVKVGMAVVITGNTNGSSNKVGDIGVITVIEGDCFVECGRSSSSCWTRLAEMRLATKEEEKIAPKIKVTSFGKSTVTVVGDSIMIAGDYRITVKELNALITHFNRSFNFAGYDLKIPDMDSMILEFGCKSGTFAEAKALHKLANE